jgi:hypothetical protein
MRRNVGLGNEESFSFSSKALLEDDGGEGMIIEK